MHEQDARFESHRPYRVLYISNSEKIIGGAERSLISILEALDRSSVIPYFASIYDDELADHVKKLSIETFPLTGFNRKDTVPFLRSSLRLVRYLIQKNIDLIHANRLPDAFYGILPGKLARVPVLAHNRDSSKLTILERIIFNLVDHNICISNWQNKTLLSEKATLLPNGIDLAKYAVQVEKERRGTRHGDSQLVIGLIGRITWFKGHETFIKAAKIVVDEHPLCTFLIAGDPTSEIDKQFLIAIKQLVNQLGLDQKIRFVGHIENVPEFISGLDISVIPSYREAFGRTLIESMALGKPVIATDVGGAADIIIPETGLIIPVKDPQALANAILSLALDKNLRIRMGKNGLGRVKQSYSIGTMMENLRAYYQMILH